MESTVRRCRRCAGTAEKLCALGRLEYARVKHQGWCGYSSQQHASLGQIQKGSVTMTEDRLTEFYEEKYREEALTGHIESVGLVAHPVNRFQGAVSTLASRLQGLDVLELAAGSGLIAESVAKAGIEFRSWTLSDWAQNRVEGMRRRLASDSRFGFAVVDASHPAQTLEVQSFDVIIAVALIEHLVDPLSAFAEARTLLRPGGFTYIDTPNIAKWTRRVKLAAGKFPSTSAHQEGLVTYGGQPVTLHDEGHLHYFSYRSLERMLLERCGFERIERVPYGIGGWPGPAIANFLARRRPTLFSEIAVIAYA